MAHTNINNLYPKPSITIANALVSGQGISVSTSATSSFSASFNVNTNLVLVDIQLGDVIVTFDGTTPVSGTRGHRLVTGTNYTWSTAATTAAKFLAATGTTAFIFASEFQV
jgi:hypothetical protein